MLGQILKCRQVVDLHVFVQVVVKSCRYAMLVSLNTALFRGPWSMAGARPILIGWSLALNTVGSQADIGDFGQSFRKIVLDDILAVSVSGQVVLGWVVLNSINSLKNLCPSDPPSKPTV